MKCAVCGSSDRVVSVASVVSSPGGRKVRVQVSAGTLHVCAGCSSRKRVMVGEALFLQVEAAIKTAAGACIHGGDGLVERGAGDRVGSAAPALSA